MVGGRDAGGGNGLEESRAESGRVSPDSEGDLDDQPGRVSRQVLSVAEVLHPAQAGAEASSANLSCGVCASGTAKTGAHGGWMEPGGNTGCRHGSNVSGNSADGESGGPGSFRVKDGGTCEPDP